MKKQIEALNRAFEENPTLLIAATAGLLAGAGKLVAAVAHWRGSAAFAKDARRRDRQSKQPARGRK